MASCSAGLASYAVEETIPVADRMARDAKCSQASAAGGSGERVSATAGAAQGGSETMFSLFGRGAGSGWAEEGCAEWMSARWCLPQKKTNRMRQVRRF
jgi:hypothetical protein